MMKKLISIKNEIEIYANRDYVKQLYFSPLKLGRYFRSGNFDKVYENKNQVFNKCRFEISLIRQKISEYEKSKDCDRGIHGPNHANAVMELVNPIYDSYIRSFSKLYAHKSDMLSALTFHKDSLIPKIEIAVGLHDIGRVAHGFDHDEYYNSPIIYTVLTDKGCSHLEACFYSVAIAEKCSTNNHFSQCDFNKLFIDALDIKDSDLIQLANTFFPNLSSPLVDITKTKQLLSDYFSFVRRIAGDADTLEIIRIRSFFDTQFYNFYFESSEDAKKLLKQAAKSVQHRGMCMCFNDSGLRIRYLRKEQTLEIFNFVY